MPSTLSAAIAYVHRRAIELGGAKAKAQEFIDLGGDEDITSAGATSAEEKLVCRAADLVGRLKLSAQLACAVGFANWGEIVTASSPPEDSAALSVWSLAQCVRIVVRIDNGEKLDVDAVSAALHFFAAAAKAEPDGATIEAARELRGDRRAARKEPGQPLSAMTPKGRRPASLRI
jgi:hypothetical protein